MGNERSTHLVKGAILGDILDNYKRELLLGNVGMGLEDLIALVFGSNRHHGIEAINGSVSAIEP